MRAWKVDRHGNRVFEDAARNFNPLAAMAGRVCVAEVEQLVGPGLRVTELAPGVTEEEVRAKTEPDVVFAARPTPRMAAGAPST